MLVWGGNPPGLAGSRYDPLTDTWLSMDAKSVGFVGLFSHTAVWTGHEMIVWGGDNSASGSRYDPAEDAWRPVSTAKAPKNTPDHTSVWSGREMIVWGGGTKDQDKTGGRYCPAPPFGDGPGAGLPESHTRSRRD